ncbi:MAG: hypothetical protein JEY91_06985 [Spirochaetaceae bacterium]|nr:hypothetical protein [Spirochaetaceae bacterium]
MPKINNTRLEKRDYIWFLEHCDSNGLIRVEEISKDAESIHVQVEKGILRAYTIRIVIKQESGSLFTTKPAGFIYSSTSIRDQVCVFDWSLGFQSSLLLNISRHMSPEWVNIPRLFEVIETKIIGGNPWGLDHDFIISKILSGNFNVYDIRELRERIISLHLPEGIWDNENLLGDDVFSLSASSETEIRVFTGYNRFIHSSGLILEIDVQTDGAYEYIVY